ncbi:MAG: hypothetical protein MK135_11800 [Polyangiaceae bacterium]|nr:hypothetical protein [Polyangiaceae bacterium]
MKTSQFILYAVILLLSLLSPFEPRLAVFALLGLVIGFASLGRLSLQSQRIFRWLFGLSALVLCLGLYRFVMGEAIPGIVGAKSMDARKRGVSMLREVLFAQDAMRRYAERDPDGDGIGSAGFLSELTGGKTNRFPEGAKVAPLSPRFRAVRPTASGPAAALQGFLFLVCLPKEGGGWTAFPGAAVDEERAETEWHAYAWPESEYAPASAAYFIDAQERILHSQSAVETILAQKKTGDPVEGGFRAPNVVEARLRGAEHAPRCDDVFAKESEHFWSPWRGKVAREELPGGAE